MIEEPRSWRLERNGSTTYVGVRAEFACIAQDAAANPRPYRHPAWQLVLGSDAPVAAREPRGTVTAPGVLVPAGLPREIRYPAGYVSLWIDPHVFAAADRTRIRTLDRDRVRTLLAAVGSDLDPAPVRAALHATLGADAAVDPRLRRALLLLDEQRPLDDLATEVGLSPRRLRQLCAGTLGGSLTAVRRWHRLREAVLRFPFQSTAEIAARTGFADQSHLVRTTVAMGGVTPGRIFAGARVTRSRDGVVVFGAVPNAPLA
ncbi:helix-turn-helix domain-containing protein [Nocardia bovistercoris]|uniref:AraC family transcriptional regulator n=1 Tax=Nocardia bovistercoris TaxID=2785916 RepID=A0A931IAU7_9NOCA|nr:helix-turn-helix domain-containing protein [Nocardia bovistercoris]MBH0777954.1 AraC family transcriptional regulator [Nocardia bovistercoris]